MVKQFAEIPWPADGRASSLSHLAALAWPHPGCAPVARPLSPLCLSALTAGPCLATLLEPATRSFLKCTSHGALDEVSAAYTGAVLSAGMGSLGVSGCRGHHNTVPQTSGVSTAETCFLAGREAGSLRSGCGQSWFLPRPLSVPRRCPPPLSSRGLPAACVCVPISSYKDTGQSYWIKVTSFNFITPLTTLSLRPCL